MRNGGGDTELVESTVEMEANQHIPGAPQSRWEQGIEQVSKQVLIVLTKHFLNGTCKQNL